VNLLKLVPLVSLVVWSWIAAKKAKATPPPTQILLTNLSFSFLFVIAYSVYVGGDAWEYLHFANRFISVVLPGALVIISISAPLLARALRFSNKKNQITALLMFLISGTLIGFQTNPISFDSSLATLGASVFTVFVAALFLLKSLPRFNNDNLIVRTSAAALFVVLASGTPALIILEKGEIPFTMDEAAMTSFGLELKNATYPGASIATMWAGAPAYYSERSMVDLLGKSDRSLARSEKAAIPKDFFNSEFWPGHNKYDLEYSIKRWSPTIVAQRLGLPGEEKLLTSLGYREYCVETAFGPREIFVLEDTVFINKGQIFACN
jgi:hypothetical protein